MVSTPERQRDIMNLVSKLDITPTMYKNAVEKYKAIANFLESCGIEADFYPQGSFAFGTVVRPNIKDPDANYDLDFICQLRTAKDSIAPNELRDCIKEVLESSNQYGGKLEIYPECFTVQYADVNGVGFAIDIVPATAESQHVINSLKTISDRPDLIDTTIAIPRQNSTKSYDWITNNPKGFVTWFNEINAPFLDAYKSQSRKSLFEQNRCVYASVDDVPSALERSAMQRVIQILKYHRDVYYSKLAKGDDLKPISAIINTIVAKISSGANPNMESFDLLSYVLNELKIYSEHQNIHETQFHMQYGDRNVIKRINGKWSIQNPADPDDNLANKWNEVEDIPKFFFKWIRFCYEDLISSMSLPDSQFRTRICNAFGEKAVEAVWGTKYSNSQIAKPISTSTASKPYGTY